MDSNTRNGSSENRNPGAERGNNPLPYGDALIPERTQATLRQRVLSVAERMRRQKWLIVGVTLAVLAASAWFTIRQEPVYESQSLLIVDDDRRFDPQDPLSYGQTIRTDETEDGVQLVVLQHSNVVAEETAKYLLANDRVPGTGRKAMLFEVDSLQQISALAGYLQHHAIKVKQVQPRVLSVTARAGDPDEAAYLANTFTDQALQRARELSRQRAATSRKFLQERMAEGETALTAAEDNLQAYMQDNNAVALDQEIHSMVSEVAQLQATLGQTRIELDMMEASRKSTEEELSQLRPLLTERVASGIDQEIELAQKRVADLELRREEIYQNYPELRGGNGEDSRIRQVEDQLRQWRDRLDNLSRQYVHESLTVSSSQREDGVSGAAYVAGLERRLIDERIAVQGLQAKVDALQSQLREKMNRLEVVPQQSIELAQLERERASSEQMVTYLDRRLQEAQVMEEAEIGALRMLQPAAVPTAPVAPKPVRNMILGLFLGLILGVGSASVRNRLDGRIYTPGQLRMLGMHILSVIPDIQVHFRKTLALHSNGTNGNGSGTNGHDVAGAINQNMVSILTPYSPAAEAFRHLYTRLQLSLPDRVVQKILVTSAEEGAGKSTTSLNLAITTAAAGRRTLIVDMDMRRPSVHRYLGIREGKGISILQLAEEGANARTIERLLPRMATGVEDMYALTVSTPEGNPLEKLSAVDMRGMFDALQEVFDIIILDTPPVLLASEAAILAPLCDATVMVANAGRTQADGLRAADEELRDAGARIMGIVLNRFDPSTPTARHTYGYRERNYNMYYGFAESTG